jgi:hypothetical protein
MLRFKTVIGGLSLCMACFAATAAEPTFTPRPPPTALVPAGKNAADLPPPRAPTSPAPVNVGTLGLPPVSPSPRIIVAPPPLPAPSASVSPAPAQPTPAQAKPALSPKPAVLKETLVRAAPIDVVRAAPIDNLRAAPVKGPAPVKPAEPAPIKTAKQSSPDRRTPVADFSAWEKNCLLPEDLPPLKAPVKIGAAAQARVDVFIRSRPDCAAAILDVLATGEAVQVEGRSGGWWRVRNRRWGSFWVGERLLAPMQQR